MIKNKHYHQQHKSTNNTEAGVTLKKKKPSTKKLDVTGTNNGPDDAGQPSLEKKT